MKTILVILYCSGRFCSWEPAYVVEHQTEQQCQQAAAQYKQNGDERAKCVPKVTK